jgi:hypothetical protein
VHGKRLTFGGWFGSGQLRFKVYGNVKEFANPKKVMLDVDSRYIRFGGVGSVLHVWSFLGIMRVRSEWIRFDRTRRGWHVVVKLAHALAPAETVAVQAILGSDPKRESINLMRVMSEYPREGKKRWNLLYNFKI